MAIRVTRVADGYRADLGDQDGEAWASSGPQEPADAMHELAIRGCASTDIIQALNAADLEWVRNGGASAPSWADLDMQRAVRDRPVDGVTPVTPDWRFVSIGFDNDAVDLGGGVNPWLGTWLSLYRRIVVAHPLYPEQRHTLDTYQLAGTDPPIVFAAGEFSNGVWGFFAPVTTPTGIRPR